MSLHQRSAPRTLTGVSAAAACIALVVAGCAGNSPSNGPTGPAGSGTPSNGPTGPAGSGTGSPYGFPTAEQVADSPITIWVTPTARPSPRRSRRTTPSSTVNVETYDGNSGGSDSFHTKISLFDQAGEGWPDVVWSTQVNDASWAAKEVRTAFRRSPRRSTRASSTRSWLDGYTSGALDPVTVDGHIYGARDNLAPVVFWYNKALFDEFGYDVPETWEDYEALGDKLAAEHPGYILGSIGDPFTAVLTNMWAAQAPIYTVDGDHVHRPTSRTTTPRA